MNRSGEIDQAVTEICEKISLPLFWPIFMFEFTRLAPRERKQYEPKRITGEWGQLFNDIHLDLDRFGFNQLGLEHTLARGFEPLSDPDGDVDLLRRRGTVS